MHDEPPPRGEYLDDWDVPPPSEPKRTDNARILVLSAGVIVVALVVAIALGATQRRAVAPVTSTSPTASATTAPIPSVSSTAERTYKASGDVPTAYTSSLQETVEVYTPAPIASDAESDPLTIKLVDKVPKQGDGAIAYRVSVCVTSPSVAGGKVHISRDSWFLGMPSTGSNGPARNKVAITPAFPVDGMYGKGECASGYVTFATGPETPESLSYSDGRFGWTWVFG